MHGSVRIPSDPVRIPSHKMHETQARSIVHYIASPRIPSDPGSIMHQTQTRNTAPLKAQCGSRRSP